MSSVKLDIKPKASLMISKDVLKEVPVNAGEKGVELVLLQDAGPIPPIEVCQAFSFLQTQELQTRYQCRVNKWKARSTGNDRQTNERLLRITLIMVSHGTCFRSCFIPDPIYQKMCFLEVGSTFAHSLWSPGDQFKILSRLNISVCSQQRACCITFSMLSCKACSSFIIALREMCGWDTFQWSMKGI